MKKTLLLILCVAFSLNTWAQKKSNQLYYNILQNKPKDANNAIINIVPVYVDIYGPNLSFGYELGADYSLDDKFTLGVNFRRAYADRMNEDAPNDRWATSVYRSQPSTNFELMGQYLFQSKLKNVDQTVRLKQTSKTTTITKVPSKIFEAFGLRLGYNLYYSFVSGTTVESGDKFDFKGYRINMPTQEIETLRGGTMMTNSSLNLGISRIRKTDLHVDFNKGYGRRTVQTYSILYADVMIGIKQRYQNMVLEDYIHYDQFGDIIDNPDEYYGSQETAYYEYHIDEHTDKSQIGIRAGYKEYSLENWGFSYGVEIGSRPGPDSFINNAYVVFNIGLNLSQRL